MISEAYKYGYEENVFDAYRQPVKEGNFQYTPNEKRKLERSAASVEHCSKVVITVCKDHSQVIQSRTQFRPTELKVSMGKVLVFLCVLRGLGKSFG
jgi:hypothetical protein